MPVRFDRIVTQCIAKPATRDGLPLYTRVDGMVDANGIPAKVSDTSEYAKQSRITCNSPDNFKRLFITADGCFVHLHAPVKGSSKYTSLKREYSYPSDIQEKIDIKKQLYTSGIKYGGQVQQFENTP